MPPAPPHSIPLTDRPGALDAVHDMHPRPARAAHSPEGLATQPAALPAWDLSDLYPAADSPLLAADLDAADAAAEAFNARYAGTLSGLSGAELAAAWPNTSASRRSSAA